MALSILELPTLTVVLLSSLTTPTTAPIPAPTPLTPTLIPPILILSKCSALASSELTVISLLLLMSTFVAPDSLAIDAVPVILAPIPEPVIPTVKEEMPCLELAKTIISLALILLFNKLTSVFRDIILVSAAAPIAALTVPATLPTSPALLL